MPSTAGASTSRSIPSATLSIAWSLSGSSARSGVTLAAVARALGVSRQAVHQRFAAAAAARPGVPARETEEEAWWRRRRELEQMAEALLARQRAVARGAQAPMA